MVSTSEAFRDAKGITKVNNIIKIIEINAIRLLSIEK
jgi:hypothetical protein